MEITRLKIIFFGKVCQLLPFELINELLCFFYDKELKLHNPYESKPNMLGINSGKCSRRSLFVSKEYPYLVPIKKNKMYIDWIDKCGSDEIYVKCNSKGQVVCIYHRRGLGFAQDGTGCWFGSGASWSDSGKLFSISKFNELNQTLYYEIERSTVSTYYKREIINKDKITKREKFKLKKYNLNRILNILQRELQQFQNFDNPYLSFTGIKEGFFSIGY